MRPAGLLAGLGERVVVADAGGDGDSLEVGDVVGGERFARADFGDGGVTEMLLEEVLGLLAELKELDAADRSSGTAAPTALFRGVENTDPEN